MSTKGSPSKSPSKSNSPKPPSSGKTGSGGESAKTSKNYSGTNSGGARTRGSKK